MNIEKIVLENFKTYKKLEFTPNQSFNMIVGENNIGKTTIFDALLLFKLAYNELLNSNANSFLKKINNNYQIIQFNKLSIFRILSTKDFLNDRNQHSFSITLDLKNENNLFTLKIEFDVPNNEDTYVRIQNKEKYGEFIRFKDYCNGNSISLKKVFSVNFTKPVANILKDEPFLNFAQIQKKTYFGNTYETLRNKILLTSKDDKFEYLEEKLKNITGITYKIRLKNKNRDDDEFIRITIEKDNEGDIDLSLVGSGILHLLEIFSSLYVKERNEKYLNLIFIDEPDSHMHFKLQAKLIDELKKDSHRQIFLTTHNDKLIEKTLEGELFYITHYIKDEGFLKYTSFDNYKIITDELSELLNILPEEKYLLLTEGKTDKKIIETAWNKLYPSEKIPFEIASPGINSIVEEEKSANAESVRRTLEYLSTCLDKKVIGLFDNDREGREQFKGLNNRLFMEYLNDQDSRKHQSRDIYGVCLPVPSFRDEFITTNSVTQRYFVIEHYFDNNVLEDNHLKGEHILSTNVFEIHGDKNRFADSLSSLDPSKFEHFKILFSFLNTLI